MKPANRKYYMIDKVLINSTPTLRLCGTTMCNPQRVKFMANALGCTLMHHLPIELCPQPQPRPQTYNPAND